MKENKYLIEELSTFGLTKDESIIYLSLLKGGSSSAYQLGKVLHIGRTKVTNVLESLEGKNMVFKRDVDGNTWFQAHPYKNLASLIEIEETDLKNRKNKLPQLYEEFSKIAEVDSSSHSQTFHYYGMEGLKQIIWNTLKAEKEMRIFEVSRVSAFLQQDFADDYRLECVRRGITHKDLTNEKHMAGWTDVESFVKTQQLRYIDPDILKIKFEIMIYNDVVAMVDYTGSEIFSIEIVSSTLAAMQAQLFDYVWKDAIEMEVIGPRGESGLLR